MDLASFKQIAFATARSVRGEVVAVHEPSVTPNFVTAELSLGNKTIYLLHSTEGLWACSEIFEASHCELKFMDSEPLSTALNDMFGISLLPKSTLNGPFIKLPGMSESDIRYWQPRCFGEAAFNWWD